MVRGWTDRGYVVSALRCRCLRAHSGPADGRGRGRRCRSRFQRFRREGHGQQLSSIPRRDQPNQSLATPTPTSSMPPRDQPESRAWRHGHQRREKDSALVAAVPTVVPPVADVAAPAADWRWRGLPMAAPRPPMWRRRLPMWRRRFPTRRRACCRRGGAVPDVAAPVPDVAAPVPTWRRRSRRGGAGSWTWRRRFPIWSRQLLDIIAFLQDMLTAAASAAVPLTQLQCDLLSWFSSF